MRAWCRLAKSISQIARAAGNDGPDYNDRVNAAIALGSMGSGLCQSETASDAVSYPLPPRC